MGHKKSLWPPFFANPEAVAQYPESSAVVARANELAILFHFVNILAYETRRGYRAEREIIFPPLPDELKPYWTFAAGYMRENGWDVTLREDDSISFKPKSVLRTG